MPAKISGYSRIQNTNSFNWLRLTDGIRLKHSLASPNGNNVFFSFNLLSFLTNGPVTKALHARSTRKKWNLTKSEILAQNGCHFLLDFSLVAVLWCNFQQLINLFYQEAEIRQFGNTLTFVFWSSWQQWSTTELSKFNGKIITFFWPIV